MFVHPLNNNRGVALLFMVLFFTAAATASVMFIAMGLKVKGIQQEGTTQQRLAEIHTALQNYYLIHYDLPDPSTTTPPNSVPTALLNLPQKYRFDNNGQQIRYDRLPASGHMTTVRNIQVHGTTAQHLVAAVLVAPGPNKSLDSTLASPYDDPANPAGDDLIVAVSLEAEALKIANHTVAVLQQAAKAYDAIFYGKNNDIDTLYYPPETRWVDNTPPIHELYTNTPPGTWVWNSTLLAWEDSGTPGNYSRVDTWYPNYAGEDRYIYDELTGTVKLNGTVPDNDESVQPYQLDDVNDPDNPDFYFPPQPEAIIDEDGYSPASGGVVGPGCVHIANVEDGKMLTNDPDRGTATLDACPSTTVAHDLAVAYGLNLVKLGYDGINSLLDPWGNPYLWGAGDPLDSNTQAKDIDPTSRDRYYWTFFSAGPDGTRDTPDDILPPADRIPGYFTTPSIPNPIP